ncbi:MAG: hypothetical protein IGR93_20505 [Hydrococcus sp. C42_A2020_068]|uniref:hypothetical protein n=1 Tax=Pleurocapsa sp. PCC 7327 TaxID=118163 RepID=UPI00029FA1F3|nr:hypothetical protein [Pleurocapsa sp. PCC 7327]AFY77045.1 hypothetical protein Ple7327_1683 [Pleurocapsa sp. PCC 7327]MBF2022405.1 hypothetical protein [Hydrococcus sp. C42_A2020_068]
MTKNEIIIRSACDRDAEQMAFLCEQLGYDVTRSQQKFETTLRQSGYEALEASDRVLEIDTTDFNQIDDETLFEFIEQVYLMCKK